MNRNELAFRIYQDIMAARSRGALKVGGTLSPQPTKEAEHKALEELNVEARSYAVYSYRCATEFMKVLEEQQYAEDQVRPAQAARHAPPVVPRDQRRPEDLF